MFVVVAGLTQSSSEWNDGPVIPVLNVTAGFRQSGFGTGGFGTGGFRPPGRSIPGFAFGSGFHVSAAYFVFR